MAVAVVSVGGAGRDVGAGAGTGLVVVVGIAGRKGAGVDDDVGSVVENADAAAAVIVIVVAPCTALVVETVPTRIVHELAVVPGAEVAGLARVAVVAAAVLEVAGVIAVVAR